MFIKQLFTGFYGKEITLTLTLSLSYSLLLKVHIGHMISRGRVLHRVSADGGTIGVRTGGTRGGTKIAKNCMKTKDLGIFFKNLGEGD